MFKKEILQIHDLISNDYTDLPHVPLQFCSPGLDQVRSRILGIDNFVYGYKPMAPFAMPQADLIKHAMII